MSVEEAYVTFAKCQYMAQLPSIARNGMNGSKSPAVLFCRFAFSPDLSSIYIHLLYCFKYFFHTSVYLSSFWFYKVEDFVVMNLTHRLLPFVAIICIIHCTAAGH